MSMDEDDRKIIVFKDKSIRRVLYKGSGIFL